MEVFNNFFTLLSEVWKDGISGASFTDIVIALAVFFIFLLLRSVVSRFIVKRIETYVSKSTNNFDNSLTTSLEGPVKFFPIVFGFFVASSFLEFDGKSSIFIDHLNRSLVTTSFKLSKVSFIYIPWNETEPGQESVCTSFVVDKITQSLLR